MTVQAASIGSLLRVQEIDSAIDRLADRRRKLPELDELRDTQAHLADLRSADEALKARIFAISLEVKRFDQDVATIDEKIHREENLLYKGGVTNPRQAQELMDEIAMLKNRREPLELKDLELTLEADGLETQRSELVQRIEESQTASDTIAVQIQSLESEIDAEILSCRERRDEESRSVDSETLDSYDEIRALRHGVGVGELVGGTCTACHESLSAVEMDKIKKRARDGEVLFTCEHCSRLLVFV